MEDLRAKNQELEQDLIRYKQTLQRMEKQWREAVAQVNGNKLGNKIEQYQN